ncbi:MAG TPA: hypothetical protein VME23_00155 [Terracidiphilus sp.]|nr:hypothetical protein [Terracidiphilus sp.]
MRHKARDSEKMAGQFGPAVLITILAVVAVLIVLLRMVVFVAPHARH